MDSLIILNIVNQTFTYTSTAMMSKICTITMTMWNHIKILRVFYQLNRCFWALITFTRYDVELVLTDRFTRSCMICRIRL